MTREFPDLFWTQVRMDQLRLGYMLGLPPHMIAEELGCSEEKIIAQAVIMKLSKKKEFRFKTGT